MNALFGKTIDLLSHVLDFRAVRHNVIVSNVANIDTPGYKPADISFDEDLNGMVGGDGKLNVSRTDARHLPKGVSAGGYQVKQTGEQVTLDTEMVNLAENQLMYNFSVELLARKFRSINTVLKETR